MDGHIEHVLQPHHISLLTLFYLTFKDIRSKNFPCDFLLYIQRGLLDEISEVASPKSARDLASKFEAAPTGDSIDARSLLQVYNLFTLDTTDHLINFFAGLPVLFQDKDEEPEPIFGRRSIFGFFVRRCVVAFGKLSFSGVIQLHRNFQLWLSGNSNSGYRLAYKDELNDINIQIFKTRRDRQNWAQSEPHESWNKGQTTGDETLVKENLRSFFEQRFHEGNDSGVRQLALLNLVRHHYINGEHSAARRLLSEAISVSRTSGDNIALQQCISLLRRLPPLDDNQKPPINEIQPNLNPLDVLYDVKKLIDETNEQPMSASFQKIVEAAGVFDHWCDGRVSTAQESDQWALYTVQATAWNAAGCEGLGDLTADIVLAFTRAGSPDNNRLTALLNIAFRRARQGNYNNALGILLDPSVWSSLSLPDYKLWAEEVWQVLTLRAARRGQDRLYHETLLPHRPPGERNLAFLDSKISLSEVLRMREREASSITMEQLLRTLWHSEFLFRMHHYRAAIVLLADVGLHFGLSKRSQRMIEDMMPQIIIGSDVELRGFAAFTLARCIIVGGQGSKSALQEAAWWLAIAEKDYMALEIYHSAMDVQYLLAVVYNTFGAEEDRDAASERYERTREVLQQLEVVTADAEVNGIIDIISRVGSWEI